MTTNLKRYRDLAIVVLLLAVPFFFLRANMKRPDNLNAMDRALLRVSAPIEFAASSLARGVSNVWTDYVYLTDVKADNERLRYENARIKDNVHRLEQAQVENQELRRLLQLRESTPGELVSAQVVGKDFTEFFRVTRLVLDRGSRDVRVHMPVIAPDGVVGAVMHVAGDAVDVQLAVDAAFALDVEDERTHARGFVRGTGDPARYACKVEMVDARDDVEMGDLLVTSGKGKWFPRGLPVARVTKVLKRELGRDQDVEAAPTVNFARLDDVLVLVTPPGDEAEPPSSTLAPKTARAPK
jgi:rod shape-determining protein MreC